MISEANTISPVGTTDIIARDFNPWKALDDIMHWAPAGSCNRLQMLRLDKLHPIVSGNKWFKLKYNAEIALREGKTCLLTFGGGYSNHLIATAFAAKEWGLLSIGIVRGNYYGQQFTPTLQACEDYGMKLIMNSKAEYAALSISDLAVRYPEAHIIPEGGANDAGIRGAAEIASLLPAGVTDVCVAVGTGTTLSGLATGIGKRSDLAQCMFHGFYVAKDFERTQSIVQPGVHIHSVQDPRFGKWKTGAADFIRTFFDATGIPLDVVYTSKMMMKVESLLAQGFFSPSANVVCIHTGGLQGNPAGLFSA